MKILCIVPDCQLIQDGTFFSYSERAIDCYYIELCYNDAQYLIDKAREGGIISDSVALMAMDNPKVWNVFCFLIAKDLSRITQVFHAWARSAMNSEKENYIWVKPVEFNEFEELKNIVLEPIEEEDDE